MPAPNCVLTRNWDAAGHVHRVPSLEGLLVLHPGHGLHGHQDQGVVWPGVSLGSLRTLDAGLRTVLCPGAVPRQAPHSATSLAWLQEACFYECEPAAGYYRRFPEHKFDPNNDSHNEWEVGTSPALVFSCLYQSHGDSRTGPQLFRMPIRADYCDAWFDACRHDMFCALAGGDFFSCARAYQAPTTPAAPSAEVGLNRHLGHAGLRACRQR